MQVGASDQPAAEPEAHNAPAATQQGDAGLLSALEFLDAWLLPLPEPADPLATPTPRIVDSPVLRASSPDIAMQWPAVPAVRESMPTDRDSRFARWRVPPGLLYWLAVGVAAGAAWRLTSSLFGMAVAALAASAALIGVELVVRAIDPMLAHRLGFARARRSARFYGAGVALGVGTGLSVAHLM